MEQIGTHEAKARLSELLAKVRRGQEFLITNRGEPVARLIPATRPDRDFIQDAIREIKQIQSRSSLDGLRVRTLREEGRA